MLLLKPGQVNLCVLEPNNAALNEDAQAWRLGSWDLNYLCM